MSLSAELSLSLFQRLFRRQTPAAPTRAHESADRQRGQVYLVGAGSGDPELLTLRAYRLLQQADVVMLDWLIEPEMAALIPDSVERIFVGKRCGRHSVTQQQLCQLMAAKAEQGLTVVRLKGGDPSIFARLGEETDYLTKKGIPFAIVPGVTAASACAAYSGIPLTLRGCATSVRFVTACQKGQPREDWAELVHQGETLVFYMGLRWLNTIAEQLMAHGMSPSMPIAVVDKGSTVRQQVVTSTLAQIGSMALPPLHGPALIIVGEVVNHRQQVDLSLLESAYA